MTANRSRPAGNRAATRVLAGGLNWVQYTTRGIDGASLVAPVSASVVTHDAISREGVR